MVWTWLKDGCPEGFFKDEHSLLLSYDMIPLRGLSETKEVLNQKGEIVTGRLVECKGEPLFVPFRDGQVDLEAVDWGCHRDTYDLCLCSLCHFVSFRSSEPHCNKFGASDEENAELWDFHWRMMSADKRRQRPLTRLKPIVEKILFGLGFQIKPARFVRGN